MHITPKGLANVRVVQAICNISAPTHQASILSLGRTPKQMHNLSETYVDIPIWLNQQHWCTLIVTNHHRWTEILCYQI